MGEALDEIQWSLPLNDVHYYFGGVHTNSVHKYFMESVFFDHTSNNAIIRAQLRDDTRYILDDRLKFEERLRSMSGIEFMVVQEPTPTPDGGDTGVWVIRKQERQKRPGLDDRLTVLGTYFVVGANIYQAASVSNILESRMLSITTTMTKMMSLAASMGKFSVAEGHYYLSGDTAADGSSIDKQASGVATEPAPAAAGNSGLASQDQPQTQSSDAQPDLSTSSSTASSGPVASQKDSSMFFESLSLLNRYHSEYMDLNPLQGEPGSLILSSTTQHVQAQQAKAEAEAAAFQALRSSATSVKNPLTSSSFSAGVGASPKFGLSSSIQSSVGKKTKTSIKPAQTGVKAKKKKTRLSVGVSTSGGTKAQGQSSQS